MLSVIIQKLLDANTHLTYKRWLKAIHRVGIDCDEGPPVPIPNTEVKLVCAEDTWREAARENK